jgi:hypothetical protein
VMYSLIVTAKMNDIDPQAWLADVLARIADHAASRLDELLPWNWKPSPQTGSGGLTILADSPPRVPHRRDTNPNTRRPPHRILWDHRVGRRLPR